MKRWVVYHPIRKMFLKESGGFALGLDNLRLFDSKHQAQMYCSLSAYGRLQVFEADISETEVKLVVYPGQEPP